MQSVLDVFPENRYYFTDYELLFSSENLFLSKSDPEFREALFINQSVNPNYYNLYMKFFKSSQNILKKYRGKLNV